MEREFSDLLLQRITAIIRCPTGLREAWQTAQLAEADTTENIFSKRGQFAWVAYYLTKSSVEQSSRYVGKHKLKESWAIFETRSAGFKSQVASKLATEAPKEVVEKALGWLGRKSYTKAQKRKKGRIQGRYLSNSV